MILLLDSLLVILFSSFLLLNDTVSAGTVQCFSDPQTCFQATPSSSTADSVDILVATKIATGWVSIGIGPGMNNADMMMLWRSSPTADWILSRRFSVGYIRPAEAPNQRFVVMVNSTRSPDSDGYYQILLRRPINRSSSNEADRTIFNSMMAMSVASYQGQDVSPTNLPIHTSAQQFQYVNALDSSVSNAYGTNMTLGGQNPTSSNQNSLRYTAILIHGIFMGISWSALSFISIFVARFMKARLHKHWFPIHRVLFTVVLLLTLTGFILAVATNPGNRFSSGHGIIGLLVFIATISQFCLGIFIDKTFDPMRSGIPLRDKLHWGFGYFLALAGPLNVILGHLAQGSSTALLVINVVVIGGFISLFIGAQFMIGQVHEHDLARKSEQVSNANSVTDDIPMTMQPSSDSNDRL